MSNGTEYCVLWTSGGRELELERKLRELGFAIYCPTIERKKRSRYDRNRVHVTTHPLYPGYLFCGVAHVLKAEQAATVLKISVHALRQGEALLVLSERQMQSVCEVEYSMHVPAKAQAAPAQPLPKQAQSIGPDDMVVFIEGALAGQRGKVQQLLRREQASIELCSGNASITVPVAVLRLVPR